MLDLSCMSRWRSQLKDWRWQVQEAVQSLATEAVGNTGGPVEGMDGRHEHALLLESLEHVDASLSKLDAGSRQADSSSLCASAAPAGTPSVPKSAVDAPMLPKGVVPEERGEYVAASRSPPAPALLPRSSPLASPALVHLRHLQQLQQTTCLEELYLKNRLDYARFLLKDQVRKLKVATASSSASSE